MLIYLGALILYDYERCKKPPNITISKFFSWYLYTPISIEISLFANLTDRYMYTTTTFKMKNSCIHVQYVLLF